MFGMGPLGTTRWGLIWDTDFNNHARHDKKQTHKGMGPVVVSLYMVEVARILESWEIPVELAHPEVNGGIAVADRTQVALEVPDIHRIEANLSCEGIFKKHDVLVINGKFTHNGDEETDVRFGETVSYKVILALEHFLQAIKRLKEGNHSSLVRSLGRGESRFVHAIYR